MKSDDMSLVARLKKAMEKKQINAHELAHRADVGQSFVYDILNGKSKNPTIGKLSSVAAVLDMEVSELMFGNNDLFAPNSVTQGMVTIPQLIIRMTDGNQIHAEALEGTPNYFNLQWIGEELKAKPEDLRIVQVYGDGMYPTLSESDRVLIDVSRVDLGSEGIYAVYDGIGINIKRIESVGTPEKPMLRVISDNTKYKPYDVVPDTLHVLGRVVWLSRSVL